MPWRPAHIFLPQRRTAGVWSGIDLSLALVAEDLGEEFALNIAKVIVLFPHRPGGQAQFSRYIRAQAAKSKPLQELLLWIAEHLNKDLNLNVLADRASLSRRTLIWLFKEELDISPDKYREGFCPGRRHAISKWETGASAQLPQRVK